MSQNIKNSKEFQEFLEKGRRLENMQSEDILLRAMFYSLVQEMGYYYLTKNKTTYHVSEIVELLGQHYSWNMEKGLAKYMAKQENVEFCKGG